jgi:hypothetical protein
MSLGALKVKSSMPATGNRRVIVLICIFVGAMGLMSLKIGASELWREYILRKGAITTMSTTLEWQRTQGKGTSCAVSYLFRARSGEMVVSHNDIGMDFLRRDGMTWFPCGGTYGSKSIPVLYSQGDPSINRPLAYPAIKYGLLLIAGGIFLLVVTYWQIWLRGARSKS